MTYTGLVLVTVILGLS